MFSLILQMQYEGFGETGDPKSLITIIVIIIAAGGFFYIVNRLSGKQTGSSKKPQNKFNKRTFRKEAKRIGLPDKHRSVLEGLIKSYTIRNPYAALKNSPVLSDLIKDGLSEIEEKDISPEKKEAEKLILFQIKQVIERNSQSNNTVKSSRQLRLNQPVIIADQGGRKYNTKVAGNLKENLHVEPPVGKDKQQVQWKRWTPLTVYFRRDDNNFSFASKVLGYKSTRDRMVLILQHAKEISVSQQRKFRRKPLERPAYFTKVMIVNEGKGKKAKRRAVVDEKSRSLGTILDISAGGCGIASRAPLKQGDLIKIEFETERRNTVIAFGKVRHIRKTGYAGPVMHVMFTRLSRANLNKINYYIYALDDEV